MDPKNVSLASDRRWLPDIYTPQPLQIPLPSPSSFWQLIAGVLVLPIISYQGKQACLSRIFAARVSSYQIRQSSPSYSGNEAGMNEPELGRYGIIWLDLTCLILDFTLITGCNCCDSVRGPRLNGLSGFGQKVATNLQLESQCLASPERIGEQRCRDIYLYSTSTQPRGSRRGLLPHQAKSQSQSHFNECCSWSCCISIAKPMGKAHHPDGVLGDFDSRASIHVGRKSVRSILVMAVPVVGSSLGSRQEASASKKSPRRLYSQCVLVSGPNGSQHTPKAKP